MGQGGEVRGHQGGLIQRVFVGARPYHRIVGSHHVSTPTYRSSTRDLYNGARKENAMTLQRRRFLYVASGFVVLTTSFVGVFLGSAKSADLPYDLVLRNARIVDGTGSPWYRADLGI